MILYCHCVATLLSAGHYLGFPLGFLAVEGTGCLLGLLVLPLGRLAGRTRSGVHSPKPLCGHFTPSLFSSNHQISEAVGLSRDMPLKALPHVNPAPTVCQTLGAWRFILSFEGHMIPTHL